MKSILLPLAMFLLAVSPPMFCANATQSGVTQATKTVTPIRSRAELDAYLKSISPDESPLSLLPTGARRRFLGTLAWGSKGVGGFGLADLQQYLTDDQIRRVLGLFGLQGYVNGLHGRAKSLTAAERSAPETPLERSFDKLYFANADQVHGNSHSASIPAIYGQLLADYQNPAAIAKLGDSDLGLLFRAAGLSASTSHAARYLDDVRMDLSELHLRGLATPAQVSSVHDQFVAARRFDDANQLAKQYAAAGIAPLPPLRHAPDINEAAPTVLVMEPDGKSMLRKAIDLIAPLRIVVVAGCHFSEDAARAIRADPELDKLFHEHAVWLADQNESLPTVLQWNREFPDQIMNVAWSNNEWSMLDSWAIPTFYVFRNGTLVAQWSGWPADTGMQTLRRHLRNVSALH